MPVSLLWLRRVLVFEGSSMEKHLISFVVDAEEGMHSFDTSVPCPAL